MSIIGPVGTLEEIMSLPPAYGGCCCPCHRTPGMVHCVPCCYMTDDLFEPPPIIGPPLDEDILNSPIEVISNDSSSKDSESK